MVLSGQFGHMTYLWATTRSLHRYNITPSTLVYSLNRFFRMFFSSRLKVRRSTGSSGLYPSARCSFSHQASSHSPETTSCPLPSNGTLLPLRRLIKEEHLLLVDTLLILISHMTSTPSSVDSVCPGLESSLPSGRELQEGSGRKQL